MGENGSTSHICLLKKKRSTLISEVQSTTNYSILITLYYKREVNALNLKDTTLRHFDASLMHIDTSLP